MATSSKDDVAFILAAAAAVLLYMWLSKPKGSALVATTPASTGTSSGCGCSGGAAHGSPVSAGINATTPINPAQGTTRFGNANAKAHAADYGGAAAPGSNLSAPGSGANWPALRQQRASGTTPASTPGSPSIPTGIWAANATVTQVTG
jgi:hypothetical protein